jgi:hypothetical protein
LRRDLAHVRGLLDGSVPVESYDRGVPLTAAENRELDERSKVSSAADIVQQYGDRSAPRSFGGAYIDQAHGGLVRVGFTKAPARHMAELRRLFPYPAKLRLFPVKNTEAELDQVHAAVADAMPDYEGIDIQVVNTAVKSNVVEIYVRSADQKTVAKLEKRFGSDNIRVLKSRGGLVSTQRPGRFNNYPPLMGGHGLFALSLSTDGVGTCGNAFQVRNLAGAVYQLTAGHCLEENPGAFWYDGVEYVGPGVQESFHDGTAFDGGVISHAPFLQVDNVIHLDDPFFQIIDKYVESAQTTASDMVGDEVCMSATYSLYQCGEILSTNVTGGGRIRHRLASFDSIKGDSGSPIFERLISTRAARAVGVQSARFTPDVGGGYAVYSHLSEMTTELGAYTVVTTSP